MEFQLIVALFYLILAISMITAAVKIVPQDYCAVVERLGQYKQTMSPGIGFIVPFVDKVRAKVYLGERTVEISAEALQDADNISFRTSARIDWQVVDAVQAVYQVPDIELALRQLFTDSLRTELAKVKFAQINPQRDAIASATTTRMLETAEGWGLKIRQVTLQTISRDS